MKFNLKCFWVSYVANRYGLHIYQHILFTESSNPKGRKEKKDKNKIKFCIDWYTFLFHKHSWVLVCKKMMFGSQKKKIFYEKWLVHFKCQTLNVDSNPHKLVFNHFSGLLTIIQYHREALSRDFAEISRKFLNSIWHLDLTLS